MAEDLDLGGVIEQVFNSLARRLWGSLPARVVSYNAAAGAVSVQPLPGDYLDGAPVALPILADVPVSWPRGGGAAITWPLAAGDHVLLVFASRPIGRWRSSGAEGDPGAVRTHALADAIAVPCDPTRMAPAPSTTDLEITQPTGGKVMLAGGGKSVARIDDSVDLGFLVSNTDWGQWFGAVATATGTGAALGAALAVGMTGKITSGAADVEA